MVAVGPLKRSLCGGGAPMVAYWIGSGIRGFSG